MNKKIGDSFGFVVLILIGLSSIIFLGWFILTERTNENWFKMFCGIAVLTGELVLFYIIYRIFK